MTAALWIAGCVLAVVVGCAALVAWLIVREARKGQGHPISIWVPDPETGAPWLAEFVMKFDNALGSDMHKVFGHDIITVLIDAIITVCVDDADISCDSLCHEIAGHGRQWRKYGKLFALYYLRPFLFALAKYLDDWAEVEARTISTKWHKLWPALRLLPDGTVSLWYPHPVERDAWEREHGLKS